MILKKFNVERNAATKQELEELVAQGFEPVCPAKVERVEDPVSDELVANAKGVASMSKKELVELAEKSGIDGAKAMKKAELVEALTGGNEDGTDE